MELQAFEVQVCAKTETRGFDMDFLVQTPQAKVSVISRLFQGANQMGSEQIFDNLTFKLMEALRK